MAHSSPSYSSSASSASIQNSAYTYAPDTAVSDAYAIALTPALTAYAAGQTFRFLVTTANTGAASLNVNALGAKTIKKNHDQDLATGDVEAGSIVTVTYDGTNFQMQSADANLGASEVAFTPVGGIAATDVQAAIAEVDTEKEPTLAAASETTAGKAEIATAAEVATGTDNGRIVSPDGLAGSYAGTKAVQVVAFDFTTDVAVGDGAAYLRVPSSLNGMNLVAVAARVITAGTTGTTDIQIANVTQAADMLTTKITIDSTETDSSTAATAAVIDANNDDVATGDLLRVDVDATATTKAKGLIVSMEFRLP